jgi:two-component system KDP operon response regulator KdpE
MSAERVLIIDDEEPIRHFLRVALGGQLYEISEAASGKEGLIAASDE